MCVVVLVVATACGSGDADRATDAPTSTTAVTESVTTKFCAEWVKVAAAGENVKVKDVLRDRPPEIAAELATMIAADDAGRDEHTKAVDAAVGKVLGWISINCASSKQRYVAPPADADLAGLKLCSATGALPTGALPATDERVEILGRVDLVDKYDGPMIAVFTNKAGDGDYLGDGDKTPVTVRGMPGQAAPITVFQQVVLPDLGTVVAWTEAGHDVAIYGRLWPKSRNRGPCRDREQARAGRRSVHPSCRREPPGYREVSSGPSDVSWSVIGSTISGDYHVRYQPHGGGVAMLNVDGMQLDPQQFEGFQLYTFPLTHVRIGDHNALFGSLWSAKSAPYVATWREPDGFTVRVTGLGVTAEQVRAVAERARDLSRAEWAQLVQTAATADCTL